MAAGTWSLPVPPNEAAQPPSHPCIEFLQGPLALRVPEVSHPAAQKRVEFLDRMEQRLSTPLAEQFTHAVHQPLEALRRDPQTRVPVCRDAVAEKLPLPRSFHRTLGLVHPQVQDFLEESPDHTHDALSCRLASDIDVVVVRITAEGQSARLQFPVQVC